MLDALQVLDAPLVPPYLWPADPTAIRLLQKTMPIINQSLSIVSNNVICGCFDGILLKPCLLQPCFHVAGDAWMQGCMDAWMHGYMDTCMLAYMLACLYVDVCMETYTCMHTCRSACSRRARPRRRILRGSAEGSRRKEYALHHRHLSLSVPACMRTLK